MRQTHVAGEKLFVDYAGQTLPLTDPNTGEVHPAQVFVAVLGYSNFTYAEVSRSQTLPDWIGAHTRALNYFGGVPKLIVPDNLKSGISKACRYEPDNNPTYAHWAQHYEVAVLPARPLKPKDKSKVEVGVQIVERWILARLRHHTFFSLSDANAAIRRLLTDLNARVMRRYGQSRRMRFEQDERALLTPLPASDYVYTEVKRVRVHIDYHVEIDKHYYSVPHAFIKQELQAFCTAERITLKRHNRVIASHPRSHVLGAHTTDPTHMPAAHRAHAQWSSERLQQWAQRIGIACTQCVTQLLNSKAHPEQAYRACLGLLALAKHYGDTRLENACARALHLRSVRVKTVRNILTNGLDQQTLTASEQTTLPLHDNVRGAAHYH
jgi:transposase